MIEENDNPFVPKRNKSEPKQEVAKSDPAPHPLEVHHEKLTSLVNNVSLSTLTSFRELRDQADAVMASIRDQQEHIQEQIETLTNNARAGLDTAQVITDALNALSERFRIELPRAATLTEKSDNKPNGSGK